MKAIKIIAAIIISVALLIAQGMLAGLFSLDKALSENSIKEAVSQTDMISELVDEALSETTVNMGGEYGEMVKAVLKTDAMETFFTDYMTAAINTGIYGQDYQEVANDEVMAAFSQGIDEVNKTGDMKISAADEEILKQAMMQEIPDLTAALNSSISKYEATDGSITQEAASPDEGIQLIMGTGVRIVLIIVCLGLMAALIALFWRSKLGFIWAAAITAVMTFIYGILALSGIESIIGPAATSSDQLVLTMLVSGFGAVAIAGIVITVLLVIVCLILRHSDKKKGRRLTAEEPATSWKPVD